jgi:hypothetical protein
MRNSPSLRSVCALLAAAGLVAAGCAGLVGVPEVPDPVDSGSVRAGYDAGSAGDGAGTMTGGGDGAVDGGGAGG